MHPNASTHTSIRARFVGEAEHAVRYFKAVYSCHDPNVSAVWFVIHVASAV